MSSTTDNAGSSAPPWKLVQQLQLRRSAALQRIAKLSLSRSGTAGSSDDDVDMDDNATVDGIKSGFIKVVHNGRHTNTLHERYGSAVADPRRPYWKSRKQGSAGVPESSDPRKRTAVLKHVLEFDYDEFESDLDGLREEVTKLLALTYPDSHHGVLPTVDDIEIVPIKGALTNCIFRVNILQLKPGSPLLTTAFLLRIYGRGVDQILSREKELYWLRKLSSLGIGAHLYSVFENGRLEQFLDSDTLTKDDIRDPNMSCHIARRMSQLHSLSMIYPPPRVCVPELWANIDSWIKLARDAVPLIRKLYKDDAANDPAMAADLALVCNMPRIKEYVEKLRSVCELVESPVVFTHNDMQYGNILRLRQGSGELVLIDMEYSGFNSRGFDIANHFCEWTTNYSHPTLSHLLIEDAFPSNEEIDAFLYTYVDEFREMCERRADSKRHGSSSSFSGNQNHLDTPVIGVAAASAVIEQQQSMTGSGLVPASPMSILKVPGAFPELDTLPSTHYNYTPPGAVHHPHPQPSSQQQQQHPLHNQKISPSIPGQPTHHHLPPRPPSRSSLPYYPAHSQTVSHIPASGIVGSSPTCSPHTAGYLLASFPLRFKPQRLEEMRTSTLSGSDDGGNWVDDSGIEPIQHQPAERDAEVARMRQEVRAYVPASHAMWGIWSIIQAAQSGIEFNYLSYGAQRLGIFMRQVDELIESDPRFANSNGNGNGNGHHSSNSSSATSSFSESTSMSHSRHD
ncbi:kinase-like protein [Ramicandelaber brevisporus]|nr:kinase-like protein [Ramicandelaber brevisporus]